MSDEHTPQTPEVPATPAPSSLKNSLGVPIAIIVAAILIAGAIIYSGGKSTKNAVQIGNPEQNAQETPEIEIAPVTEKDHIRGNPNAPITIIEYSDFDCPFCKNFHETMQSIMETYGRDGKVAWVYRHFPLQQLHPNAPKLAEAAECVASLGGNDAFWKFSDAIFNGRDVREMTDVNKLPDYAGTAGVEKAKFSECLSSGKFSDSIKTDIESALKTGARGTPYSILIVGDQQGVINGAQPLETVQKMLDTVLSQIEGGATPESN